MPVSKRAGKLLGRRSSSPKHDNSVIYSPSCCPKLLTFSTMEEIVRTQLFAFPCKYSSFCFPLSLINCGSKDKTLFSCIWCTYIFSYITMLLVKMMRILKDTFLQVDLFFFSYFWSIVLFLFCFLHLTSFNLDLLLSDRWVRIFDTWEYVSRNLNWLINFVLQHLPEC